MESYNAVLLNQKLSQQDRLILIRDLVVKQLDAIDKIELSNLERLE